MAIISPARAGQVIEAVARAWDADQVVIQCLEYEPLPKWSTGRRQCHPATCSPSMPDSLRGSKSISQRGAKATRDRTFIEGRAPPACRSMLDGQHREDMEACPISALERCHHHHVRALARKTLEEYLSRPNRACRSPVHPGWLTTVPDGS